MTIKLNSLARWQAMGAGQAIAFDASPLGDRLVRLNLNCERQTTFWIVNGEGEPRLLCTVNAGVETLEFYVEGEFLVITEEGSGEVHYQTSEHEPSHFEVPDPVVFTKIAQRRDRNPEFEELLYRSQMNLERRLAQQAEEFEAALAAMKRHEGSANADDTGAANRGGATQVQSQSAGGEEPGEAGGGDAGSEKQGSADNGSE